MVSQRWESLGANSGGGNWVGAKERAAVCGEPAVHSEVLVVVSEGMTYRGQLRAVVSTGGEGRMGVRACRYRPRVGATVPTSSNASSM